MTPPSLFKAIGLMSGTSMDGIDVAFIETDGEARLALGPHASLPYPAGLRHTLLRLPGNGIDVETVEREVTDLPSATPESTRKEGLSPHPSDRP
jgi:1,6-anhydro-N-acetylmuramate kinase